jgi:hypothetical protein
VTVARPCYAISRAMTVMMKITKNSRLIHGEILRESKTFVFIVTARSGSAQRE